MVAVISGEKRLSGSLGHSTGHRPDVRGMFRADRSVVLELGRRKEFGKSFDEPLRIGRTRDPAYIRWCVYSWTDDGLIGPACRPSLRSFAHRRTRSEPSPRRRIESLQKAGFILARRLHVVRALAQARTRSVGCQRRCRIRHVIHPVKRAQRHRNARATSEIAQPWGFVRIDQEMLGLGRHTSRRWPVGK